MPEEVSHLAMPNTVIKKRFSVRYLNFKTIRQTFTLSGNMGIAD